MSKFRTVSPDIILEPFGPEIVAVVNQLRVLVHDIDPSFTEAARPGWRSIAFRHPEAGYVCGAFPFDDHVRFLFEHGVLLDDPAGILEGATRQTRHVDLLPGRQLPLDALRDLISQAVALGEAKRSARKSRNPR